MDDRHFDDLTRVLSGGESRRRVLAHLAALPVVGGLLGGLEMEEASAAGRRKRRKKAHKHGKGRRRNNRRGKDKKTPTCTPESAAQTCAGKCGSVTNTCGQSVDCGSCVCSPPCGICQTCDVTTGQCLPDPQQQGDACGAPGQICQADGTCSCDDTSCPVCRSCTRSGECSNPCSSVGCCDGVTCQPGTTNAACGSGGATCEVCTGQDECLRSGSDEHVACTCVPDCAGKVCGDDGCGGTCGTCSGALTECSAGQCGCPAGSQVCGGFCVPNSCEGGSLDGCNCSCSTGVVCISGSICAPAPTFCSALPGWQYCEAQGTNRRYVPPCPAGQTLSQDTCLCS